MLDPNHVSHSVPTSVKERRRQRRHPQYAKPELLATGPNQCWSWDITKLKGPVKWSYYYLYVVLDIFSRYVVGWMVATQENSRLAKALIAQSYSKQAIVSGDLTLHADRGSSMSSKALALLLADLGVTKSHSRPHVCDDNPYSEAQFKTLKYRPEFPARLLGVSTSGYYAWVDRGPSTRDEANARLLETINGIHQQSRRTYGAPRITAELREEGHLVGKNRVARLMKVAGIEGVSRRRKTRTTLRGQDSRPAPDLVERNFQVSRPNRLWVADITYVPSWAGFVYLAVVVDAFSRRVVGWSLRNDLKTRLVTDALQMALQERESDGVIHHSDQGTQYTSIEFGLRCKRAGIRPSMGSVGDCYDNALCESFFASLECELIDRHSFRSKLQAKLAVFDYIEGFYNPHRRHSSLDYLSPINYESRHSDVA